jgi:intron-binding protein aquarius
MERKSSQLDYLNQMPLFPTEEVIWDENLVPNDFQQQSTNESCLALPKLGFFIFY